MPIKPDQYIFKLDPGKRPPLERLPEKVIADIGWYNSNRASARRFHPVDGIEGVVLHATAGGSSGGALSWWKQPGGSAASAHWIIPGEQEPEHGKSVIAVVYEALAAWHVRNDKSNPKVNGGKAFVNHWTLGIEIVNRQTGGDPYSKWQVDVTAELVRYCWAKYPNLKWVFSHAAVDPQRRVDPGPQFPWADFEARVKAPQPQSAFLIAPMAKADGEPCSM